MRKIILLYAILIGIFHLLPTISSADVSVEERLYLTTLRDKGFSIDEQAIFPNIEDNIIVGEMIEPLLDACNTDYLVITNLISEGKERELDDTCYQIHTLYIHYPQKTGNVDVDILIKEWISSQSFFFATPNVTTYFVSYPSPRYISVGFNHHAFPQFIDRVQWHFLNFDLNSGLPIALEEIFPDLNHSIPLLEDYILGNQIWRGYSEPGPDRGPLDLSMSRISLKEDGLYIVYNPYEQGGGWMGEAERTGFIPIADMPKLGGEAKFWER